MASTISSAVVSLLRSTTSTSTSSHCLWKFPFISTLPAKSASTVSFRANSPSSADTTSSNVKLKGEDQVLGRRGMMFFTATAPLLLHFTESMESFTANAEQTEENVYEIMKEEIRKVVSKGKAAGVLRFVFHDAGTFQLDDNSGGMNGSVIYELGRPENKGLKAPFKILEKAKIEVDAIQPVSWADMIAVAGAEAVSICGGPTIQVSLGRLDSKEPDPEGKLPEETLDASGLKQSFQTKGLSTQELVALSGAHTLGNKGFGSPTVFDNSYFKVLLEESVTSGSMSSMTGLPSDRALPKDDECLRWIKKYADDQNSFFEDFEKAYIKLVNLGAKWKSL